ncbi:hypothetical protein, partial [Streptomyces clavuligerus]
MVLTMLPGAVEQGHRVLEAVQDGGGGAAVVAGVGVAGGLGGHAEPVQVGAADTAPGAAPG